MRRATYLASLVLMFVCLIAAQPVESYSYQILYTGRTLGYARIPDQQTLPPSNGAASKVAQELLAQFKLANNTGTPQFRLAMGDNFSPDLFGRSIQVKPSISVHSCDDVPNGTYSSDIHLPKDYFTFVPNDGWHIWCRMDPAAKLSPAPFSDNVADFLIQADYDAVVPGKHDFYFGPQYLRQMADYLAGIGGTGIAREKGTKQVRMLGANLILASSLAPSPLNAHPRIPERLANPCHFNTGGDHECYHTDFGPASLDLPDNVLPWKRQFVLHGARSARIRNTGILIRADRIQNFKDSIIDYRSVFDPETVEICVEPGAVTMGDPAKVLRPGHKCYPLVASDKICDGKEAAGLQPTCKSIYPDPDHSETDGVYQAASKAGSTDIVYLFKDPAAHLSAGLNHMFCAKPSKDFPIFSKEIENDPTVKICQPFPVQLPMFWPDPKREEKAAPGMAVCVKDGSLACPYALVNRGPEGHTLKTAIFAVVDADLLSNVGMLNASWRNEQNKHWDTAAQITAPDFALKQTLELCNADDECRLAPKILMAQMSYARATQLISNSGFSSVFDVVVTQASAEHDTGIVEKRYQGATPRFALTPPIPISTESLTDDAVKDQALAQAPTRVMSMQVFTPQVYVATITKEPPPRAPGQTRATPAPRPGCMTSPLRSYTPPPVAGLPSNSPPRERNLHDFGPCWTMRNSSARLDFANLKKPDDVQQDLEKFSSYPSGRPRPLCRSNQTSQQCLHLESLAREFLAAHHLDHSAQLFPLTNPAASDPVSQSVLVAMRNELKADAAIIQTRDLYDADNLSSEKLEPGEIQDQISRIIWKGDEAIVLHVTGATIRKLLKQSAAFATLDNSSLNTEIETGRSLVTLGIYPDPKDSDTIYINGAVMSDTALYTIAATDFISGGDTGYANLSPPDVLPALRVHDFARPQVHPIAGLVCKAINPQGQCADMRLGKGYFDGSTQPPSDATAGFSTLQHWDAFLRYFRMPRRPFPDSEEAVQQRPFWSLKLENLDFSETGVFINHFGKTTSDLGGISNPLLANKGSQSIGADHKARLVFDYLWGTAYLLTDSAFQFNATTAPGPPGIPSLANNVAGFEAGGSVRLPVPRNENGLKNGTTRLFKRPSWLSAQYSIRYEREIINPFDTEVALTPQPNSAPSIAFLRFPTPKINTIYGRLGLRAESGNAYLEMGLEEIDSRNLLAGYAFASPSGTYYCQPAAAVSLTCSTDPTFSNPALNIMPSQLSFPGPVGAPTSIEARLQPNPTSYRTPGAYLNFYWKFPLWSRRDANRTDQSLFFTLTNKGDIYFNTASDTAVQTRYLDKLTPAISFPIWAGISLTPKVDFILYENKINRYHYRSVQPSISLSYTFTWREGMSWARALRYGAQTTTPSAAGSTH